MPLLNGATVMAYLASALFFLRFWTQSRDRLFGLFALAFTLMGINTTVLTLLAADDERRYYLYIVRLFSFLLILYAIWDKNRAGRRADPAGDA
jgi:peptidoglycan/LPS O-acetylase OafA/YrhL